MRNIVLVAGLPGSSKTTYWSKWSEENSAIFLDDFDIKFQHSIDDFYDIVIDSKEDAIFVIVEPKGVLASWRNDLFYYLGKFDFGFDIQYVFYENDKEQCLKNSRLRGTDKKVEGFIKYLSKNYNAPENAQILKVWREEI